MKKFYVLLFVITMSYTSFAQTANSVSDGSFLSPATWDCMCVPTDGYIVTINHDVTLNSNWMMSFGSITINSGGSLVESGSGNGMMFTGTALLDVKGTFTYSKLAMYGGSISNSGIMNGLDSLYMGVNLVNDGAIYAIEFINLASLTNNDNLDAVNFFNASYFLNNMTVDFDNFFNDSTATNTGTMLLGDFYNNEDFTNQSSIAVSSDFTNAGQFLNESMSVFSIQQNATNLDSVNHDAALTNNGDITIYINFLNADTLKGSGNFCVGQLTANYGFMDGTFEFCDNTPPASAPFIDISTGFIGTGITWCTGPCLSGIENSERIIVEVYPNPAHDVLKIISSTDIIDYYLSDMSGRIILAKQVNATKEFSIDLNGIASGIYHIVLNGENLNVRKLIIKE